jgi:hypothetical protein
VVRSQGVDRKRRGTGGGSRDGGRSPTIPLPLRVGSVPNVWTSPYARKNRFCRYCLSGLGKFCLYFPLEVGKIYLLRKLQDELKMDKGLSAISICVKGIISVSQSESVARRFQPCGEAASSLGSKPFGIRRHHGSFSPGWPWRAPGGRRESRLCRVFGSAGVKYAGVKYDVQRPAPRSVSVTYDARRSNAQRGRGSGALGEGAFLLYRGFVVRGVFNVPAFELSTACAML